MPELPDDVRVTFTPSFKKRLRKKPMQMQAAIVECVRRVIEDPRHPGLRTHRLRGTPGVWEASVDRGNRLTFHREPGGGLVFRNHCHHDILRTP